MLSCTGTLHHLLARPDAVVVRMTVLPLSVSCHVFASLNRQATVVAQQIDDVLASDLFCRPILPPKVVTNLAVIRRTCS